jgi:hypothetical protein
MKQNEVGLHIGACALSLYIQRMNQYVIIGQLPTEALEKASLGLNVKPLRNCIRDSTGHVVSIRLNKQRYHP